MRSVLFFHFRRFLAISFVYFIFIIMGWATLPFQRFVMKYTEDKFLTLRVDYFGADAKTLEKIVVKPLEEVLLMVNGVKSLYSMAQDGSARLVIEVDAQEKIKKIQAAIKAFVDQVQESWPKDVQEPLLLRNHPGDFPDMVISFPYADEERMVYIRDWLERFLKPSLENISGVAECTIVGGKEREIQVSFYPEMFWATQVQGQDIIGILQTHNLSYAVGVKEENGKIFPLLLEGKYESLQDIGKLRILTKFSNESFLVELDQLASVKLGLRKQESFSTFNGQEDIGLYIYLLKSADNIKVGRKIRERLQKLVPSSFEWKMVYDRTEDLAKAVAEMWLSVLIAILLLLFITWVVFRKWEVVFLIFSQIPFALAGLFLFLFVFQVPFDTMMMAGVILGCGIIVDNGIIVSEYIISVGSQFSWKKFFYGFQEIVQALFASFLTTEAIFIPLLALSETLRENYSGFFIVLTLIQMMAIFFSVNFLPVALIVRKVYNMNYSVPIFYKKIFSFSRWGMRKVMRERIFLKGILTAGIFLSVGGIFLFLNRPPGMCFYREIFVSIDSPGGTPVEDIRFFLEKMEQDLISNPKVEKTMVRLERKHGEIIIRLKDFVSDKKILAFIHFYRKKWEDLPLDIVFNYEREEKKNVLKLHFLGLSREILQKMVTLYAREFFETGLVEDIVFHFRDDAPFLLLEPDFGKMQMLGISTKDIGQELHLCFSGGVATKYLYQGKKLYDVRLLGEGILDSPVSLESLRSSFVRSAYNQTISVADLFHLKEIYDFGTLYHYNKMKTLTVSLVGKGVGIEALKQMVSRVIESQKLPMGYLVVTDPEVDKVIYRKNLLKFAFFLAIWLVGLTLVLVFGKWQKAFLCLGVFPGMFIGVFGAQLIGQLGSSEAFLLGCVFLSGIVVNNSALVITDRRIEEIHYVYQWFRIIERKFFPLLTTNLTTLVGALPLLFTTGEGKSLWVPLSLTLLCGLTMALLFQIFGLSLYLSFKKNTSSGNIFFNKKRDEHSC